MTLRHILLSILLLALAACASLNQGSKDASHSQAALGQSYTVRKGDTLYAISKRFGYSVPQIMQWNGLKNNTIYPGQVLQTGPPMAAPREALAVPMRKVYRPALQRQGTASQSQANMHGCTDGGAWQWPARGEAVKTYAETTGRLGLEIAGQRGQTIYAAADGEVIYSGAGVNGFGGELILLRHNNGFLSTYARAASRLVAEGERVDAGQAIATMGLDPRGRAALYFEISCQDKTLNPTDFLP